MTEDEFKEFDMTEDEFDIAAAKGEPAEVFVPKGWHCQHMSITVLVPKGWHCQHMSLTSTPAALGVVTAGCGCTMHPVWTTKTGG